MAGKAPLNLNPSPTRQKRAGEKDLTTWFLNPSPRIEDGWEKGRVEGVYGRNHCSYTLYLYRGNS